MRVGEFSPGDRKRSCAKVFSAGTGALRPAIYADKQCKQHINRLFALSSWSLVASQKTIFMEGVFLKVRLRWFDFSNKI